MNRRTFLSQGTATALLFTLIPGSQAMAVMARKRAPENPRWYGFNLLEFFSGDHPEAFHEQDFEMMAEWKFNFARIPMSYWNWSKPNINSWMKIDESAFRLVDQVVDFGKQYQVHINLNLHRIPGYCVNNADREPIQLFSGKPGDQQKALEAATFHWEFIAARYKDRDSRFLSFDLINEPAGNIPREKYLQVIDHLAKAIRAIDPDRRIVVDGFEYGNIPILALAADKTITQSTHGYAPMQITHYKASWVGDNKDWPEPTWPLKISPSNIWNKERLQDHFKPWLDLNERGVGVHVGEWGVHNRTPHEVTLAFMRDQMSLWKQYGWGWSLWNLRGSFGVMDSGRTDISYESYKGHQLDRKMLETLMEGKGV